MMVISCDPLLQMIYSYTRKQALENVNLIDVTEQAKALKADTDYIVIKGGNHGNRNSEDT
ncbi:hypothetical protein [Maridesulfovibrio sp.]|uniref:hypothetical protein n=1 Tax=Maridesulfovibrio sp. TaxID=2795000 RepID=UPI003B00B100